MYSSSHCSISDFEWDKFFPLTRAAHFNGALNMEEENPKRDEPSSSFSFEFINLHFLLSQFPFRAYCGHFNSQYSEFYCPLIYM